MDEEVTHVALLDYVYIFLSPWDFLSHKHRLSMIFSAWLFVATDSVFDPCVLKSEGLKLAFKVALFIDMEDCRRHGFRIQNQG